MGVRLSINAVLYIDELANLVTPTWDEVKDIKDVTLNLEKAEADVSRRGGGGWGADVGTLKRGSIDFNMVNNPDDPRYAQLLDSFLNGTPINVAVMDGPIATAGSQGFRALMEVMKFTRNEPLEDALGVDVTLKPTYHDTDVPEWLIVEED